ncbi:hypothetical protein BD560DRAFT_441371 [Blakeslea trispora]|nr:hypothetical protein BD560DRAFT_441371 [Blakeslea trispora]
MYLCQSQAQANEALRRNETVASVLQLQVEIRCSNTKKACDQRQSKFIQFYNRKQYVSGIYVTEEKIIDF